LVNSKTFRNFAVPVPAKPLYNAQIGGAFFIHTPTIDIKAMGFPTDWQNEPLWQ